MPTIASKRARSTRAPRKRTSPVAGSRFDALLRDQSLLLRCLLAITALLLLAIIVEAWAIPFSHRVGEYTVDGIAARVDFRTVDEYSTKRARDEAREAVHPIFRDQPAALDPLPASLRADLEALARAKTRTQVPADTLVAFGLTSTEPGQTAESADAAFQALKTAIRKPVEGTDQPIDTLIDSFRGLLSEVERHGVITVDELKLKKIRTDGKITIVGPEGRGAEDVVTQSVLLSQATGPAGFITTLLNADPSLKPIAGPLRHWIGRSGIVTLKDDQVATDAARKRAERAVDPVYKTYHARDMLVPPDQRIDDDAMKLLVAEHAALQKRTSWSQKLARSGIVLAMIGVLAFVNGCYFYRNQPKLFQSSVRISIYLAAVLIALALGRYLATTPWRAEIVPLISIVMIIAIAYDQMLAILTAFTLSTLIVLSTTGDLGHFVVLMAVSAAASLPLSSVDSRIKLIKIGFLVAGVYLVVSIGLGLLERQTLAVLWSNYSLLGTALLGAFWCLVASYFVAGNLPFIENVFGIVTDVSLLEMTDVSHPLLQDLVSRAPGTYNHSMAVASIGETAADAIGANGLLVRVGAYFHDVGKMLKPHYFVENMSEGQRSNHERLAPAMSTLIIIGHVKDGADLAREQNLPRRLIDFIEQHHGTTLVEYFYREATRRADEMPDHKTDAEESAFRYPGPKPQTKEAGVMMLADAVESASRTLSEPTPKRIENLVHGISLKRLLDGQFDESGMTLNEIRIVEESLIKSLTGIYHGRIKYPDQTP